MVSSTDVEGLSDNELRDKLQSLGQNVPPITDQTRSAIKRKLQKLLTGETSKGKSPGKARPPSLPRSDSPSRNTRQNANAAASVVPDSAVTRTPSPPIAPMTRQVIQSGSPKRAGQSGAAFSSDEEEEASSSDRRKNLTAGTPLAGNLNGRSVANRMTTDSPSKSSGMFAWMHRPKTSTPTGSPALDKISKAFGSLTPIRDEQVGVRSRHPLTRQPLSSFTPTDDRRSALDPIHLTPDAGRRDRYIRHEPARPKPLQFSSRTEDVGWISRSASFWIVFFVVFFFAVVGGMYLWMKWKTLDMDSLVLRFELEGRSEADNLFLKSEFDQGLIPARPNNGSLYSSEEALKALNIARALSSELAKIKGEAECKNVDKTFMSVNDARSFALNTVSGISTADFSNAVDYIVHNPQWGIKALGIDRSLAGDISEVRLLESDFATKSPVCRMKEAVASMIFKVVVAILVIALIAGIIYGIREYMKHQSIHEQLVFDMVNKIIALVQRNHEQSLKDLNKKDYIAVSHVRETLVPHGRKRKEMLKVFDDAVKYLESHESRIRSELQIINGDEFLVWVWMNNQAPVPQPDSTKPDVSTPTRSSLSRDTIDSSPAPMNVSTARARLWSGGARVDTRAPESLTSVTPCLKIRGLFNGDQERHDDTTWTDEIKDAILEKCHGVARILDMRVEAKSPEGVTYVKLASNEDARNAFLAMHGQYFDGTLVNVKFLRLDRYHQRFPDAVHMTSPIHHKA